MRLQYSNPINVKISKFGSEFIRDFANIMQVGDDKPDLGFHPGGYLFLAGTPEQEQTLRENHEVQKACGADVVLWGPDELAKRLPASQRRRTSDLLRTAARARAGSTIPA